MGPRTAATVERGVNHACSTRAVWSRSLWHIQRRRKTMKKTGSAEWKGGLKDGTGTISTPARHRLRPVTGTARAARDEVVTLPYRWLPPCRECDAARATVPTPTAKPGALASIP